MKVVKYVSVRQEDRHDVDNIEMVVGITNLLQNSLQIELQQPNVIAKYNTKITRPRVKLPFVGVFRGGNRVQVKYKITRIRPIFAMGFAKDSYTSIR
jgi:hypothetical protein